MEKGVSMYGYMLCRQLGTRKKGGSVSSGSIKKIGTKGEGNLNFSYCLSHRPSG